MILDPASGCFTTHFQMADIHGENKMVVTSHLLSGKILKMWTVNRSLFEPEINPSPASSSLIVNRKDWVLLPGFMAIHRTQGFAL